MIKAKVYITLKRTVADPQGLTIKHALESLGYQKIKDMRMGKLISIELDIDNKKDAERLLNEMCRKLLANPIIEDYSFKITGDK